MKITAGLLLLGLLALLLMPIRLTIYARVQRDTEFTFVVVDGETGEPVPGATIQFFEEDDWRKPEQAKAALSVKTDAEGKAVFFKEKAWGEDIPVTYHFLGMSFLAEKRTYIDPPWPSVRIAGPRHLPFWGSFFDLKSEHQDHGYDEQGQFQRFEYRLPLSRLGIRR
jgi:hypothetical protein